jgi:hypothetical protein
MTNQPTKDTVNIYSTCRACNGLLHVTNPNNTVHPTCPPKPKPAEKLTQQWLQAATNEDTDTADRLETEIEHIDSQPPRLLDAALIYASWNWPVFPLKTASMAAQAHDPYKTAKTPATKNGFKDATTDTEQIRAWWTRNPDAGIGLATGHHFDVIDIDTPAGIPTYLQLLQQNRTIHGQVTTASGGIHLYTATTGQGCRTRMLPGVDVRGAGGYVIAPPTRLLNNRRWAYTWNHLPSPFITGKGDTYGVIA